MMDRNHLNQKTHENANCLQEFVHKMFKMSTICKDTYTWRRFLHWSTAVSIMTCEKSGLHTANPQLSIPSVY